MVAEAEDPQPPEKEEGISTLEHDIEAEVINLKARAYDLIAAKEQIQGELSRINQKIAQLNAQTRKT